MIMLKHPPLALWMPLMATFDASPEFQAGSAVCNGVAFGRNRPQALKGVAFGGGFD